LDEIVEGARAQFHLLPRPVQAHGASEPGHTPELGPLDVTCRLRTLGTGTWHEKKLDAVSWQHVGHGVYVLTVDPADLPPGDGLAILVEANTGGKPRIEPILRTVRVVPPRAQLVPGDLPVTTVCGRLVALDGKPRVKAPLTFRIHQPPLLSGGIAVTGEMATCETDDRGFFQIDLVTGACVAVQVQAIAFNRILVVPPPPAPGIPVRLFSI
jgi:hypothetical protein